MMAQLAVQLPAYLLEESKKIAQLKKGQTVEEVSLDLSSIFRPLVQPYLISWLAYNPVEELSKFEIPIFIAGGTTDLQLPIQDAERLQAANDWADRRNRGIPETIS